jgi:hypothetical protein
MTTLVVGIAVIAGGYWLVRSASTFKSGLMIVLCVAVLLGLWFGSQN